MVLIAHGLSLRPNPSGIELKFLIRTVGVSSQCADIQIVRQFVFQLHMRIEVLIFDVIVGLQHGLGGCNL